jgi:hypothetical protein
MCDEASSTLIEDKKKKSLEGSQVNNPKTIQTDHSLKS